MLHLLPLYSANVIAQKQLSNEETQNFYQLIMQTQEYKKLKVKVDSINAEKNELPEKFNIRIIKKESGGADDDYVFEAVAERRSLGMVVEYYSFHYDKRRKNLLI